MSLHRMKEELHQRLWAAQERWFALSETGVTKHDLKKEGLRDRGDIHYASRCYVACPMAENSSSRCIHNGKLT